MSEWKEVDLSDVVSLQRGLDLPSGKRRPGPYPILGSSGISGWHDQGPVSGPGVTIGRSGSSIGKATWHNGPYWPLNTTLFVKNFLDNNPRYIFHLLDSIDFTGHNSGSAQPSLNRNFISSIRVKIPDIFTQNAIANSIGALDDKIAANERIISALSELSAAIFLSSHSNRMVSVSEISQVTMGQSPPGDTYNETAEGLPFYQGTRDFGFRFPGKRVWCTAVTRRASAKDVLVSVRAPVGTINVATEECGIGRGLAAVRSTTHPHTLLQALSANNSIWVPYEKEGTVFGSINSKQFSKLEIPWPEESSLTEVEERLKSHDDLLSKYTAESQNLAELRDTLLPQLMSGKLRVKDAEKIVEDNV